ncbi:MAG: hypothetical protein UFD09_11415 [Prevotella sp.]|nr:hypothetical protein [Prevotella sp.]
MTDSMGVEPEGETAKIVCTEKEIVQGIKKNVDRHKVYSRFFKDVFRAL